MKCRVKLSVWEVLCERTAGPGGPTLPAGPGKPVAPYRQTQKNMLIHNYKPSPV